MIQSPASNYSVKKDGITQSLLAQYMACPRRFAIATHGLSKPASLAMELGSLGHHALEHQNIKAIDTFSFDKAISTEEREQAKAVISAIAPAYFKRYVNDHNKYKVNREYVFDIKNFFGARLRGKVDAIMSKNSKVYIRETKFKSRISEDELDRSLALDWQSLFYVAALAIETGSQPCAVEYDVVRYPTIKFGMKPADIFDKVTAEIEKEPDRWFMRWETRFDELDIFKFTGELSQKIKELSERKLFYRNECSCKGAFKCPYIDYCATGSKDGLIKRELFSELK